MGTVIPGIKIQAQRLQGLLDKQMIAKAGIFACLTIALIPLWLFMVSMGLFPRIPSLLCLAVLTAVVMVCAAGALILFRIWIPPAAAVAGLSLAYPLWGWRPLAITQAYMRSEEHTSDLQYLMRISFAAFWLHNKNKETCSLCST